MYRTSHWLISSKQDLTSQSRIHLATRLWPAAESSGRWHREWICLSGNRRSSGLGSMVFIAGSSGRGAKVYAPPARWMIELLGLLHATLASVLRSRHRLLFEKLLLR